MALTKCKECGAEISKSAKTCPACGYPIATKRGTAGCLTALGLVGAFILVVITISKIEDANAPATKRTVAQAPPQSSLDRQLKVAAPACLSSEVYEKIESFFVQKDTVAAEKLLSAGLLTGQCTMLKKGQQVVIEEVHLFGSPCVRIRGDVQCWYTSDGFLEPIPSAQ